MHSSLLEAAIFHGVDVLPCKIGKRRRIYSENSPIRWPDRNLATIRRQTALVMRLCVYDQVQEGHMHVQHRSLVYFGSNFLPRSDF